MRRLFKAAALLTLLLASCSPQPVPVAEPTGLSSPTADQAPAHASEIRFALIGAPTNVNVWALFDEAGASHAKIICSKPRCDTSPGHGKGGRFVTFWEGAQAQAHTGSCWDCSAIVQPAVQLLAERPLDFAANVRRRWTPQNESHDGYG